MGHRGKGTEVGEKQAGGEEGVELWKRLVGKTARKAAAFVEQHRSFQMAAGNTSGACSEPLPRAEAPQAPLPVPAATGMWHPLLSPFCMATMVLCLQQAASSHANGPWQRGLAPAACLGGLTPGQSHTASLAQRLRVETPPAQQGGHEITTNSPGFGDVALGNREIKRGSMAASVMEVNTQLWRKSCQAEQGTIVLLDKCYFWNNITWSFNHRACRFLPNNLYLLYCHLTMPLFKATSILVTMITSIQLLSRCTKRYQSQRERKHQSKEQWPVCVPSMVWGAADYPECAICLQEYKPREALKLLSCSHPYHSKCIDLWHHAQLGSKTCPLCLRRVTTVALIPLSAHNSKQE